MKANKQAAGSTPSFEQMVAGLSHQLNNPLAAILGYSELLLRRDLDADAMSMLELIHVQAERCKRILQSLNEMTRRPAQGFRVVDLHALLRDCVAMKASEFETRQIQVQTHFTGVNPTVRADALALQQAFLLLFDNALESLEEHTGERSISISASSANGWVAVRVEDTGPGIKPDVLPRIFEPFFTTKPKDENTGLGLTLCLAILEEHEGRIEVDSTEGRGTCVTVFLPAKVKPAAATSDVAPSLAGKTILVAEDEPALAQLLSSLLTPFKAQVVHVNDGQEALDSAREGHFDLIISDIQMPRLSGIELCQQLASSNPGLADRMILITGDSASKHPELLLQGVKAQFLYKPFSRSELINAISRVLADRKGEDHPA